MYDLHICTYLLTYSYQGRRQWCLAPSFKICAPHFTFGPLVGPYIQYSIFKMWNPFWFLAPLLLYPGDGPDSYVDLLFLSLLMVSKFTTSNENAKVLKVEALH